MVEAITTNVAEETATTDLSELVGKYLTFNLMNEHYGVSVDWILQIVAIPEITKIPKMPPFVMGVINLRGKIIPIIDLRLKFSLAQQEYNERTSIVIIRIVTEKSEIFIGTIVDNVVEVLDIHAHEIERTPTFGVDLDARFIAGMAKVKNRVVTLLNISNILTDSEIKQLTQSNH